MLLTYRTELNRLEETIFKQDESIMNDGDFEEDVLNQENEEIEKYRNLITISVITIDDFTNERDVSIPPSCSTILNSDHSQSQSKRTYKLPKIEIKKFNGELLDWLSFWSQFEKIHNDDNLHNSDKFQYLAQAMQEGTRAKE